jgi:hypothetical protein
MTNKTKITDNIFFNNMFMSNIMSLILFLIKSLTKYSVGVMKYSGSALYWILVTSFSLTRLIYIIKLLWRNYLIQFKVIHTFDFQWNWLKILWTDGCLLTTGMSLPAWTCYYNYYTKLLYIYQSFLKIIIYIFFCMMRLIKKHDERHGA